MPKVNAKSERTKKPKVVKRSKPNQSAPEQNRIKTSQEPKPDQSVMSADFWEDMLKSPLGDDIASAAQYLKNNVFPFNRKPSDIFTSNEEIIARSPDNTSGEIKINGKCPICWENLPRGSVVSTICGHLFCKKCLETAIKCKKQCPKCKKDLEQQMVRLGYIQI